MTTTAIIINLLFILCLTASVAPRSIGLLKENDKPSQRFIIPLMFGLTQAAATGIGYSIGRLIAHLFVYIADYMVFIMMLVVALKMFVDSISILKGKMLYTVNSDWDIFWLTVLAAMNTLLMSLMGSYFMPFGMWFFLIVALAGFFWSFLIVKKPFEPKMMKKLSFVEFSAAVFMVVIAILYLFTDLMVS